MVRDECVLVPLVFGRVMCGVRGLIDGPRARRAAPLQYVGLGYIGIYRVRCTCVPLYLRHGHVGVIYDTYESTYIRTTGSHDHIISPRSRPHLVVME